MLAQTPDVVDVHVTPAPVPDKTAEQNLLEDKVRTHSPTIRSKVDLVLVPVTVTDPMNRLVTGLDKENFQVFEGKDQQEVRHFSSEDAPISLGVIFDMSGSMSSKIERAREAVMEFFKTANPQDEFFLIAFADKPQEVSDFTQSVDDLQTKLIYTVPRGRTALLDAIYLGIIKMREAAIGRRVIKRIQTPEDLLGPMLFLVSPDSDFMTGQMVVADGGAALASARGERPDLVVLDLGLPTIDGLDVARELRRTATTPIVMLTARGEESDRIVGLELGADDSLVKPFSPKELVARVRAVLR